MGRVGSGGRQEEESEIDSQIDKLKIIWTKGMKNESVDSGRKGQHCSFIVSNYDRNRDEKLILDRRTCFVRQNIHMIVFLIKL